MNTIKAKSLYVMDYIDFDGNPGKVYVAIYGPDANDQLENIKENLKSRYVHHFEDMHYLGSVMEDD